MLENEPTGDALGNASKTETQNTYDPAAANAAPAETGQPRRRRRAASRPAGPPEPAALEPTPSPQAGTRDAPGEPGGAPAASGSHGPQASPEMSAPAAPPAAAEQDRADRSEPAEAERPARTRRTRKKAAAAPPAAEVADQDAAPAVADAPAQAGTDTEQAPAETEKPKRRRTRKQAQAVNDTSTVSRAPAAASRATGEPGTDDEVEAAAPAADSPDGTFLPGSANDTTQEPAVPPLPVVTFQPPTLLFQPPEPEPEAPKRRRSRHRGEAEPEQAEAAPGTEQDDAAEALEAEDVEPAADQDGEPLTDEDDDGRPRRRRRGGRGRRGRGRGDDDGEDENGTGGGETADRDEDAGADDDSDDDGESSSTRRRRRRRRRGGNGDAVELAPDDPPNTVVRVREPRKTRASRAAEDRADDPDEVQSIKGSTRLEAKKQRRREGREQGRRRAPIITEAEFLARRESVDRMMVVRQIGGRTQIAVLEDGVLVEHYVNRESAGSYVGNVYLGKVQNVLPSMEAAFVDIGKGRNAVLYAGEVNFDAAGLEGSPKRIESALKSGQSVLVQVTKDPMGHKGARLTSQISLPGRYLVYVPDGSMTGISRKLPDTERSRLKAILKKVVPDDAGVIVRTAAEGASEEELSRDVTRLAAQWEDIKRKVGSANPPALLYGEPDLTVRVIRDIFNEDFGSLVVSGDEAWDTVRPYLEHVAPDLVPRLNRWTSEKDVFAEYRIDEQLMKALDRKVWLPSGGSLVIDRTEAMVVVDVNTGKFTGKGGNLEETVTKNNLEAAEEIVRQLRLRDLGGIIVIDFIDMVLESNRDLVLRRLLECLGRDRTKHQVAEVTSLGLVQMTRKRVGQGLLEAFSETCDCCNGRGVHIRMDPVEQKSSRSEPAERGGRRKRGRGGDKSQEAPAAEQSAAMDADAEPAAGLVAEPVTAAVAVEGEGPTGTTARLTADANGAGGRVDLDDALDREDEDEDDGEEHKRRYDDSGSVAELLEPDVDPLTDGDDFDVEEKPRSRRTVKRVGKKAEASSPAKKAAKKPAKRATKRASAAPATEPE
jgi:ribonuclease E